ncbi:MAG TPA: hypothetical protein VL990_09110 [Acidobacteriaceae bacterium]|nr:hypothetical protein [Acidobacteriaceae bacterium]
MSEPPQQPQRTSPNPGLRAFVTGMIIAGSALVGGLAVVLWNRKTLSGLRQNPAPSPPPDDEEE